MLLKGAAPFAPSPLMGEGRGEGETRSRDEVSHLAGDVGLASDLPPLSSSPPRGGRGQDTTHPLTPSQVVQGGQLSSPRPNGAGDKGGGECQGAALTFTGQTQRLPTL
jgi:hypothetical protein